MRKKPLVVVDTSLFISALLSSNPNSSPNIVIDKWLEGYFTMVMTPQIEMEIAILLNRKQIPEEIVISLFDAFEDLALYQKGIYQTNYLDAIDPKDNMFLSASYEAQADYLISLDKHLLNIKHFHNTLIFNPRSFIINVIIVDLRYQEITVQ